MIVAHEGTDRSKMWAPVQVPSGQMNLTWWTRLSIVTDVEFVFQSLDKTLFPGLPSGIQVHDGFSAVQAK